MCCIQSELKMTTLCKNRIDSQESADHCLHHIKTIFQTFWLTECAWIDCPTQSPLSQFHSTSLDNRIIGMWMCDWFHSGLLWEWSVIRPSTSRPRPPSKPGSCPHRRPRTASSGARGWEGSGCRWPRKPLAAGVGTHPSRRGSWCWPCQWWWSRSGSWRPCSRSWWCARLATSHKLWPTIGWRWCTRHA